MNHVVFIGAMGSGKTTIGTRVAHALGRQFVDNDAMLERATGRTAATIAAQDGAAALHQAEADCLLRALRESDPMVIAAAASTIADQTVRDALTRATVVWLRADPASLVARMPGSVVRPFGDQDAARLVREQADQRDSLFAGAADVVVFTDDADVDAVVARVVERLRET